MHRTLATTVHIAGAMLDNVQRCTRCNNILIDYQNVAFPLGDTPYGKGWVCGAFVGVVDNHSFVMQHDAKEKDEAICA